MDVDHRVAPGSVQPANLTRYTECLTSASRPGLRQDGHRGIVVSVLGPAGVWPAAPIAIQTGSGHIYRQGLGGRLITPAALRAVRARVPEPALAALPPLNGWHHLHAIPVPNLVIVILLKEAHG